MRSVAVLCLIRLKMRARSTVALLSNPLILLLALSLLAVFVWVLVSPVSTNISGTVPPVLIDTAAFGYGLVLLITGWSGQRGSPLRISRADAAWLMQSPRGPQAALLYFGLSGSLFSLIGASLASAGALTLRGISPVWGVVTALSVMALVLFLRAFSLTAHLLSVSVPRAARKYVAATPLVLAAGWTLLFILRGAEGGPPFDATKLFHPLIRGVVSPEQGLPLLAPILLILGLALLTRALMVAQRFVEPAVDESMLAGKIADALSDRSAAPGLAPLQSRGLTVGKASWTRWPEKPELALITGHLAQLRRRVPQSIMLLVACLLLTGASLVFQDAVPSLLGPISSLLVVTVSSPSQPLSADLDRQHLSLSGVSTVRAGYLGIAVNAGVDFFTLLPALLMWTALSFGSITTCILSAFVLALVTLMCSLGGIAVRAFSEASLGRTIIALLLTLGTLGAALSALEIYGGLNDPIRTLVTVGATAAVAATLLAGAVFAVLRDAGGTAVSPPVREPIHG